MFLEILHSHLRPSSAFIELMADIILEKMPEAQRTRKWWIFAKKTEAHERRFKPVLRKLFRSQKAVVMANINRHPPPKGISKDRIADWMFPREQWEERFRVDGKPFIGNALNEAGQEAIEEVLVGVDFQVTNPRVVAWLNRKVHKFSFETNDTTIKQLKKEFAEALREGEGIPKIRKRVEKVFGFADKVRTERIARTEVIGATNAGTFEGYTQSGVVPEKEWLETQDDRTRDKHTRLLGVGGDIVALDKPFSNGLMFPGDPEGSAEEIIN